MDEMAEVMNEFEERLEEALEHDYATPEDIAVIRAACGKPKGGK